MLPCATCVSSLFNGTMRSFSPRLAVLGDQPLQSDTRYELSA